MKCQTHGPRLSCNIPAPALKVYVICIFKTEEREMPTLYERLGGAPAVDAAIDIFYHRVLADGRISRFFDNVNMEEQIAKQKSFLTMAFGGPNKYTGKDMREAHKKLVAKGLNDMRVDAVVRIV